MKQVCILGLGKMGQAMGGILANSGICKAKGCGRLDDPNEKAKNADVIVIAVNPDVFGELSAEIKIDLKDKLVISVMAGVSIKTIKKKMQVKKVVRMMPNMALKVEESVSGWIASEEVNGEDLNFAKSFVSLFGDAIEVDEESKLNMITALSGSGPAYFYTLAEIIEDKAVEYGFDREDARRIAESTFTGAANFLFNEGERVHEMKKKIISKGGPTEKALKYLEEKGFKEIMEGAIDASKERAEELDA